ncbi:hypothetical protein, partial [Pseudomonas viridiflava]|uniref:hypothetical protein n=1 Tax=Pseudomonas viridiflava TaxID=33069 RepID=UPI00197EACC0
AQPPTAALLSNFIDLHKGIWDGHAFLLDAEYSQAPDDMTPKEYYKEASACHDKHTDESAGQ